MKPCLLFEPIEIILWNSPKLAQDISNIKVARTNSTQQDGMGKGQGDNYKPDEKLIETENC